MSDDAEGTMAEEIEAPEEIVELTVGERLRNAREERGLDLRDVAAKTRQSQDTLAALETMDADHIPATIRRMQARNYARFLGLPEDEIASAYAEARGTTNAQAMPNEVAQTSKAPRVALLAGAGALALALVLGVGAVLLSGSDAEPQDQLAVSARISTPGYERADILSRASEVMPELSLRAKRAAWIEVRGSDGTVFRSRDMDRGEVYFPRTGAGWSITVRDAGAFDWRLGENVHAAVGEDGQALYSINVDNAFETALNARTAALAEAEGAATDRR